MIKIPKEVKAIIEKLEKEKFKAFVTGECTGNSLAGWDPFGWDVSTSARLEDLYRIFPEADVISEKYGVVRMDFVKIILDEKGDEVEDGIIVDISTFRKESAFAYGRKSDEVEFADTIEEDLARRDFTMYAIADSGHQVLDPYNGFNDIKKKLVRTVGDPAATFAEDPARMLKAIRIAAELDFDLAQNVYEAIRSNYKLLEKISVDRFRNEFIRIMAAAHAGKGFNMILDTGIINLILGEDVVNNLTKREKNDMITLSQNIDRSKQVFERRLGLFYTIIDKKKAIPSIEKFNFDEKTHQYLIDAVHDMPKLYFAQTKELLKKFIYQHGMDRYNYLANLEKAQRIVFDYDSDTKIKSKMYLLEEIHALREPIFIDDLTVDANDLIEVGICDTVEEGEKLLGLVVEKLHQYPLKNKRDEILKLAKKYKNNKIAAATRKIRWVR